MAVEVDRDTYESEVLAPEGLILVDFWGPQCQPCLALLPAVEALEGEYAGRLKVTKVNASKNMMLCAKLRIIALPTILLYKDGVEIGRLAGQQISKRDVLGAIDAALG